MEVFLWLKELVLKRVINKKLELWKTRKNKKMVAVAHEYFSIVTIFCSIRLIFFKDKIINLVLKKYIKCININLHVY